jgi:SagB-type dehydrogenase family enzyme
MKKGILTVSLLAVASFIKAGPASPKTDAFLQLPPPQTQGGMPLLTALSKRSSTRSFQDSPLPRQTLSSLLWAAFGVNRPDGNMRTAPSSYNWQDIDLYVFTAEGVWLYDAVNNRLKSVKQGDHRRLAGMQGYVRTAPLSLVYVSDTTRMTRGESTFSDHYKFMIGCIDAGHISQNVYLYCASAGLGAVARASVDREQFAKAFNLPTSHNVIFGQTVGYIAND